MKPDILLIRAYGRDDGSGCLPWGIIHIASYLKKYGYNVIVMDRQNQPYPAQQIIKEISKREIEYVGISAMTTQLKDAVYLCKYFKRMGKKVILGGLHYTVYPEEGLKVGDYVFAGEAEQSLLNFFENGPKKQLYESEPLLNLDDIPLPEEKIIKRLEFTKNPFMIMTSRGCPYNCIFCLDKKHRFERLRYHSYAYVCDLLEMLVKSFGVRSFFIGDDIFTINKERVSAICREIKKRSLKIKLGAFSHSGIDDPELYKEMKSAGFESLSIGVESGDDKVLEAMNKKQTVSKTIETIEIIKKSGLNVNAMFMVGNMFETEKSLQASLELARSLRLNGWVSYAQPFPGTRFYEIASRYGRIINNEPQKYWNTRITFIPSGLSSLKLIYYRCKIALELKAPLPLIIRLINKISLVIASIVNAPNKCLK